MKNILHLIDLAGPGGAETVFAELVAGVDRARWRPFAAVCSDGWTARAARGAGVEPILIPKTRRAFDRGFLSGIIRAVRQHRIDLVQAHLLSPAVYGSVAALLTGVPLVATFHGQVDVAADERFRYLKFGLLRLGARRVVFVSDALRKVFLTRHPLSAAQTAVIHNGIDPGHFQPRRDTTLRQALGVGPQEILVGAVGNLRPSKGYDVFLRAAALVAKRDPAYRFVVFGQYDTSDSPPILAFRDQLGLRERVIFAGYQEDVARAINNLDLFLLTSREEGFSLATIEAMACGVPVVVTRSGGPEEIVTADRDGLMIERGSPEAVADAVLRLGKDRALRERLTAAAAVTARERFTTSAMVGAYERLYEAVTSTR
ncbi:MAG TPA: glycosyltransferase family 4 protein [Gemmatimonadales bacterium]|nr:glycosyltransferase family 4 protein [Gemmatimonadales bacterium]